MTENLLVFFEDYKVLPPERASCRAFEASSLLGIIVDCHLLSEDSQNGKKNIEQTLPPTLLNLIY